MAPYGSTCMIPAYYSFIDPERTKKLSWPGWLTCHGWFTHNSGHPSAAGWPETNVLPNTNDANNSAVAWLITSAIVHLGTDQIQHVVQPTTLITMGQRQRRHAANTNYWYCWNSADLQKKNYRLELVDWIWLRISIKFCANSRLTSIMAIKQLMLLRSGFSTAN